MYSLKIAALSPQQIDSRHTQRKLLCIEPEFLPDLSLSPNHGVFCEFAPSKSCQENGFESYCETDSDCHVYLRCSDQHGKQKRRWKRGLQIRTI